MRSPPPARDRVVYALNSFLHPCASILDRSRLAAGVLGSHDRPLDRAPTCTVCPLLTAGNCRCVHRCVTCVYSDLLAASLRRSGPSAHCTACTHGLGGISCCCAGEKGSVAQQRWGHPQVVDNLGSCESQRHGCVCVCLAAHERLSELLRGDLYLLQSLQLAGSLKTA